MSAAERGASSAIGVILIVALTVILSGSVVYFYDDVTQQLHEPSFAALSADETTIEDPDNIDESGKDGCGSLSGHRELAVNVTLTYFQQADVIYVLVTEEGAETKKVLWSDPSSENVGERLTLANEQTGVDGVDVDIGGGDDWAYCPGEDVTFSFYARYDGRTSLLQEFEF